MPPISSLNRCLRLIRADAHTTTKWAGGETTQLALFPATGAFADRNFDCRISTATVQQSGPFTALPGFKRILCLLEGNGMELNITTAAGPRVEILREPLARIDFDGGDTVTARLLGGPVRDFNVIFRPAVSASVCSYVSAQRVMTYAVSTPPAGQNKEVLVFCAKGEIEVADGPNIIALSALDLVILSVQSGGRQTLTISGRSADAMAMLVDIASGSINETQ